MREEARQRWRRRRDRNAKFFRDHHVHEVVGQAEEEKVNHSRRRPRIDPSHIGRSTASEPMELDSDSPPVFTEQGIREAEYTEEALKVLKASKERLKEQKENALRGLQLGLPSSVPKGNGKQGRARGVDEEKRKDVQKMLKYKYIVALHANPNKSCVQVKQLSRSFREIDCKKKTF